MGSTMVPIEMSTLLTLESYSTSVHSVYWLLMHRLATILRSDTRRIPCPSHLPYATRSSLTKLESLEIKRLRFDSMYYYKVLGNLTPSNPNDYLLFIELIRHPGLILFTYLSHLKGPTDSIPHSFFIEIPTSSMTYNTTLNLQLLWHLLRMVSTLQILANI